MSWVAITCFVKIDYLTFNRTGRKISERSIRHETEESCFRAIKETPL